MPYTILIASAQQGQREYLAVQLDADGHDVYESDATSTTVAKLATHAIDVALLAGLERRADSPALLRAIRAGEHRRIHPGQAVVTLGPADEMSAIRAYEAGSDHHLPDDASYLLLRAVVLTVARRALEHVARRDIQIGDLHIDTAGQTAIYNGQPIRLSRSEYGVLVTMASDPGKLFTRAELGRAVWGSSNRPSDRTVDSHVCRLRRRLSDAGATDLVSNTWGRGWALLDPLRSRQGD
jgi:DNA-binding response OmpR family regulator